MYQFTRWLRSGLAGLLFAQATALLLRADDAPTAEKSAESQLQKVLERLDKVERELLDLRIKSGKVPADRNDQRVLTLIETPYLGSAYYGAPANQRFLALKVMLVNLTGEQVVLARDDVKLTVDGQEMVIKEAPQQIQFNGFQIGQQQVQLRTLQTPKEIRLASGATTSTWMLFPELPAGNHVPHMILKLKFGEKSAEIDINTNQRNALGLKTERIGPRSSLGLISISGSLDTINVGSLVDELDRLTADKVVRAVIRWDESGTITDPQLMNWLHNAVANAGRQAQNDTQFPSLPAALREVHLARVPNSAETPGIQQAYPAFYYQNPGAGAGERVHKSDSEAVISALRTAYETLPRDELQQAIQTGTPFERAAALAGGGGRLGSDKLPLILKCCDDNEPLVQQAAIVALGHFGDPPAVERLLEFARKADPALASTAIASLASSRYAVAHQALLDLLANEPPDSKKAIVRILSAFPRPVWADAIYEFVKDSRAGLNIEALQALVQVGHPKLIAVLSDALHSSDPALSQTAFGVLAARADRESEDLALNFTLDQLRSNPPTPTMLQLLNRVKDQRALPLLMTQFGAQQERTALIQTLGLLGNAETAKFLAEKFNNLQSHEKSETLKAISRLDRKRFRTLASQSLLAADGGLINSAVQGLVEEGSPESVAVLADALDTSMNNFTWSYLSNALWQLGTPAARAALLKARESENQEKRRYAVDALQNLSRRSPGFASYSQARQLSSEQKWKEAIENYDVAVQLDPAFSDAFAERGHALLHLEKGKEAGKDFAKAWDLDPYNSLALTGMCLVQVMTDGKHAEAVEKLEESRSKFSRNPMFNYNAACVYGRAYELLAKSAPSDDRDKLLEKYKQAAFADLKSAIQGGFQDFELMKKDPDLAPFRELPDFQQLMAPPPEANGTAVPAPRGVRRGTLPPAARK